MSDSKPLANMTALLAIAACCVHFALPRIYPAIAYAIVVLVVQAFESRWQVLVGGFVCLAAMGALPGDGSGSTPPAPGEIGTTVGGVLLLLAAGYGGVRRLREGAASRGAHRSDPDVAAAGPRVPPPGSPDEAGERSSAADPAGETPRRSLDEHRGLRRILFDDAPVPMMLEDWSGIKAMVRELRASGVEDWDRYFESHPEFFTRAQERLVYLDANKATVAMFGATDKAALMRVVHTLLPKAPTSDSAIVRAMVRGEQVARGERRIRTLDGRRLAILWRVDVSLESDDPMLFVAIDITERMNAEEALSKVQAELTHATRAAVLGEMVASIAHEVNQPLAATSIYAESALRWLNRETPNLEKARAGLQKIVRSSGHAADVIQRIKGFVRKEVAEYGALDVRDVLADTELIVQREARNHRVELRFELQGDTPAVRGVKVQVQQVLVNLIVNAVHALADHAGPHRWVSVIVRTAGPGRVGFEVRDSGPGLPAGDMDRLFEPFFSTKSAGLGLGLSICRRIVEVHGGTIRAANHESGASFLFELDAVPDGD